MKHYLWNMCANIKNGQIARKYVITQKRKNFCESLLRVFWDEGLISGYRVSPEDKSQLEIFLKYANNGEPAIKIMRSVSRPGKRVYCPAKDIWKVNVGEASLIFSTDLGLKSLNECKLNKIGGEPLLFIY